MNEISPVSATVTASYERSLTADAAELWQVLRIEAQEAAVVGMPTALEVSFEKERGVDPAQHQHSSRRCKPTVELLRPSPEQDGGSRSHRPLRS